MKVKLFRKLLLGIICLFMVISFNASVFAAGNCAFSVGGNFVDPSLGNSVIAAQQVYSSMGYYSYYSASPTYNILNGSFAIGTKRLESDIIYATGHGANNRIRLNTNTGIQSSTCGSNLSNFVDTTSVHWSNTRLVILLACQTGKDSTVDPANIAVDIYERSNGLSTALGWRSNINMDDAISWGARFNYKLKNGGSVGTSINYANSFSDYNNNTIKDLGFYGTWNNTYTVGNDLFESQMPINMQSYVPNTLPVSEKITFTNEANDLDKIIDKISNMYGNFDRNNYEINVYNLDRKNNYYTIDLRYKIGDIYTNQGYVVSVENGVITAITNNMKDEKISKIQDIRSKSDYSEEKEVAKALASKRVINSRDNFDILNQDTSLHLDEKNNSLYVLVETTYSYSNDHEALAVDAYRYYL